MSHLCNCNDAAVYSIQYDTEPKSFIIYCIITWYSTYQLYVLFISSMMYDNIIVSHSLIWTDIIVIPQYPVA